MSACDCDYCRQRCAKVRAADDRRAKEWESLQDYRPDSLARISYRATLRAKIAGRIYREERLASEYFDIGGEG